LAKEVRLVSKKRQKRKENGHLGAPVEEKEGGLVAADDVFRTLRDDSTGNRPLGTSAGETGGGERSWGCKGCEGKEDLEPLVPVVREVPKEGTPTKEHGSPF